MLRPHTAKLFGLTIAPQRLQQIRNERRPGSRYAALAQCEQLIDQQQDYAGAARQVRALMFIARFADDIERRREQLGQ